MTVPVVVLRAYRPEEYDEALSYPRYPAATARAPRRERLRASGGRYFTEMLFAIEADGRLVGEAQARFDGNLIPPGVFELGIELFRPEDRGRGIGTGAISAFLERLFGGEGAERVQGSTDLENAAMRRTFERLGFTFEGTMRGFMPSEEGRRDYALYGITRQEWRARGTGSAVRS
jgi:RimJ/RimL family protein N-acetyltransferase